MRVADVDVFGAAGNTYTGQAPVTGPAPDVPWAVHLADRTGRFRLLCFDLDAGRGDPIADAAALQGWLRACGLPHLLAASGPAGGRHVWLALADPAEPGQVAELARLARGRLPSLDPTPLLNPRTGCARPPGAPHRLGGASTVLDGDVASLTSPDAAAAGLEALAALLGAGRPRGATQVVDGGLLPVDARGRLHLVGARRPLPAASAAALEEDAAARDASSVLWRVLIGAVHARWRCEDVAAMVERSPGLEHVRSARTGTGRLERTRRTPQQAAVTLARHWDRAVRWVAANPRTALDQDPTFPLRAEMVTGVVERAQARADASPGRWARAGGPAQRRVLDALCLQLLRAASDVVEADIRRLGLLCGIGRETARTALLQLAEEGWITQRGPAQGRRGAQWSLPIRSSTAGDTEDRSQVITRPLATAITDRSSWVARLLERGQAAAHDVFAPAGGLGHHAGQVYAALGSVPVPIGVLASRLGRDRADVDRLLRRLQARALVVRSGHRWRRGRVDRRGAAARALGVDGRLRRRAERYALEREAWAWWCAELEWMTAARRTGVRRRAGAGQMPLVDLAGAGFPAHPRRCGGRADFSAARRALESGTVRRTSRPWGLAA